MRLWNPNRRDPFVDIDRSNPGHDLSAVHLRPEEPSDEPLLFEIYASTRQEELNLTNWDAATRHAFVTHQFNAMRLGYRNMFPHAAFSMILLAGEPVGRQVVDRTAEEIRLVDIALLPQFRGHGIGSHLLRELLAEAAASAKPVRLQTIAASRATGLYLRFGFRPTSEPEIYQSFEWRAESSSPPTTASSGD
jgi:GNAT superfamily N-acetyltransferase